MKFSELEIGRRFEYAGRAYVKAGPVAAREEESGKSRMIPRSAVLRPLDEPPVCRTTRAQPPDRSAVMANFERFYEECLSILSAAPDSEARARLQSARQRFLDAL